MAVELARRELRDRSDVFTHDALAWALSAAGRNEEARNEIAAALAEGTKDARLFFHAAVIAARAGRAEEALAWAAQADPFRSLLLPSERAQLDAARQASKPASRELGRRLGSTANTLSFCGN